MRGPALLEETLFLMSRKSKLCRLLSVRFFVSYHSQSNELYFLGAFSEATQKPEPQFLTRVFLISGPALYSFPSAPKRCTQTEENAGRRSHTQTGPIYPARPPAPKIPCQRGFRARLAHAPPPAPIYSR